MTDTRVTLDRFTASMVLSAVGDAIGYKVREAEERKKESEEEKKSNN